jgi:hypothetical protein
MSFGFVTVLNITLMLTVMKYSCLKRQWLVSFWRRCFISFKQFLFLIRHPRSYSYIVKSTKVLAMIQEIKHLRQKETSHCLLRHEYFITVNMSVIFNTVTKPKDIEPCYRSQFLYSYMLYFLNHCQYFSGLYYIWVRPRVSNKKQELLIFASAWVHEGASYVIWALSTLTNAQCIINLVSEILESQDFNKKYKLNIFAIYS